MKPGGIVRFLQSRELGRKPRAGTGSKDPLADHYDVSQVIAEEKSTLPSSNQACELSGESRSTFLMTFSPDGTKVASTHGDHSVRVTDLQTGKCLNILTGHPRTPWCIAFHPASNDILASGCLAGQVRIWDLCGGGSEVWSSPKGLVIASLTFHPIDQVLVFATANEIFFWDWSEPEPFANCKTAHEYEKVRLVKFDPLGQYLYTGIANASTVHSQEEQPGSSTNAGYVNLSEDPAYRPEESYQLQRQYQSVVHQINNRQRDRLRGVSGSVDSLGQQQQPTASTGLRISVERQADLDVIAPRSPPPTSNYMDGVEEARAYAATVTREANQHVAPSAVSVSQPSTTSSGAPVVARLWNEQLMADHRSRDNRPRAAIDRQSLLSQSQIVVMDNRLTTATGSTSTNSRCLTVQSSTSSSSSVSTASAIYASSTAGSSSSLGSRLAFPLYGRRRDATSEPPSTGLGSDATINRNVPSNSSAGLPSTSTEGQGLFARRLSRRKIVQSSTPRSRSSVIGSSRSRFSPLNRDQSGSRASRFSQLNTIQPVTVVSQASTEGETGSGSASVLRSHLTSQLPQSNSSLFSFSSQASSRPIMSTSTSGSSRFPGLQSLVSSSVSSSTPSSSSPHPPTIPVVPTRFSRSTSSREGSRESGHRLRQAGQPQRLASIIESEVRQALDQVLTNRLDLSESLQDLDAMVQQDMDTDESRQTPATTQSSSTSGQASPTLSTLSTTATAGDTSSDTSSSIDGNDGRPLVETVTALGAISTELDQRIQLLDNRVSEIQHRLNERIQAFNQDRLPGFSQERVSPFSQEAGRSGSWQSRRQRLRVYLDYLRNRYGFSSGQPTLTSQVLDESAAGSEETRNEEVVDTSDARQGGSAASAAAAAAAVAATATAVPTTTSSSASMSPFRHMRAAFHNMRQDMPPGPRSRHRDRAWFSLQRRNPIHPHYSVSILDDTINTQNEGLQSAINRAIAGAFMARGESNIASNIVNLTNRIQRWDFTHCDIPDISDSSANVIIPQCKLHTDATCDISQDGQLLAVFIPSHRGFPDDVILAVYSLRPGPSFKQCLYTKSFGPNVVSVSLSPLNNYVLVGLASRRISWVFTTRQMVAQVYQLMTPEAGEDSTQHICDLMHPCDIDIRTYVSVNAARWLPAPGQGIIYGTNRGDLHICRPGYEEREKANPEAGEDSNSIRRNLMQFLGRNVPRTISAATQTVHRVRRTASTQTEGLGEIDEDSIL